MVRTPATEGRVLRPRGASLIVLAAVTMAVLSATVACGTPSQAPPQTPALSPPTALTGDDDLPLCGPGTFPRMGEATRAVGVDDLAAVEEALGFALPARPRCGVVMPSAPLEPFDRLVHLSLGHDRAAVDAVSRRLESHGWEDRAWSGPPDYVRDGVHVQPWFGEDTVDGLTGLRSNHAVMVVLLP